MANVDDDRYQLGIVVIITGGLMGFAATCFSVLYWCFRFDPLKDHTLPGAHRQRHIIRLIDAPLAPAHASLHRVSIVCLLWPSVRRRVRLI